MSAEIYRTTFLTTCGVQGYRLARPLPVELRVEIHLDGALSYSARIPDVPTRFDLKVSRRQRFDCDNWHGHDHESVYAALDEVRAFLVAAFRDFTPECRNWRAAFAREWLEPLEGTR